MKRIILMCVALCALLLSGGAYATASLYCEKNPTYKSCPTASKKKHTTRKPSTKPKIAPRQRVPEMGPARAPIERTSRLTPNQDAMRDAYMECVAHSTAKDPTKAVLNFVYTARTVREQSRWRSLWKAFRGSTEHHGHEICLTRVFGLKVFRTNTEITSAQDTLLELLDVPFVDIPDEQIPEYRRSIHGLVRPWVGEYIESLAGDYHAGALLRGFTVSDAPLLRVTSMTRSAEEQNALVRRKLSPADCMYEFLCSSHTSGSSVDLGFKGVAQAERDWLKNRLIADQSARKIFFIIENSHYHVFVLPPDYMGEEQ